MIKIKVVVIFREGEQKLEERPGALTCWPCSIFLSPVTWWLHGWMCLIYENSSSSTLKICTFFPMCVILLPNIRLQP